MNELTIKSRKTGEEFRFWMDADGGYVYREFDGRPGTLGQQITRSSGATIRATPETFEKECRNWYRAQISLLNNYY